MAKSKASSLTRNWQDNYAGLILGAIIVVVLGLLVANFLTNRNGQIDNGDQIAPTAEEQAAQAGEEKEYKVVAEDSLSKIAEREYGSMDLWPVIAQANNISNPNVILVDSTLKIPSKADAQELQTQMTQTSYEVQEGDTLFIISEKMYGDGSRWMVLDKANRIGRLPNGNPLVFAGTTITIPR